jgi:2-keto-3-deoxy-L-rhamnonate aldolase RhmA
MSQAREIRRRLYAGERVCGTMAFEFFTPGLIPLLYGAGCDWVILDTEHSGVGIETIKQQIAYARGLDVAVWVRVPEIRYAAIAPMLDAGAQGIMVPMLETVAQAHELVGAARYRPEGARLRLRCRPRRLPDRGCRRGDPRGERADRPDRPDREQKRHRELRGDHGHPRPRRRLARSLRSHQRPGHHRAVRSSGVRRGAERLARACAAAGKPAGAADASLDFLRRQTARGYRLLGYSADVAVMRSGYVEGISALRALA